MGGLAIGRISYDRWLRFVWVLLAILAVIVIASLSGASLILDTSAGALPASTGAAG
jgi:uncharacterized ion transporter superfamily protein YfcC